jgi:hypothetical protein
LKSAAEADVKPAKNPHKASSLNGFAIIRIATIIESLILALKVKRAGTFLKLRRTDLVEWSLLSTQPSAMNRKSGAQDQALHFTCKMQGLILVA